MLNGRLNSTTGNGTNVTSGSSDALFVQILTYVDYVNRILSMLVFLLYFLSILKFKFLRNKALLYVHHSNLVGFMFCVMYIFYYNTTAPTFANPVLNNLFCRMSEINWSLLKYLRSYSILIIAYYRLMGVFFTNMFKKINSSIVYIMMPIVLLWLFAGLVFVATKFGFSTTYGSLFCIDGYSTSLQMTVDYLIVTSVISILIPFVSITVIYYLIRRKLAGMEVKMKSKNVKSDDQSSIRTRPFTPVVLANSMSMMSTLGNETNQDADESGSKSDPNRVQKKEFNKKKRLNQQLIAINICYFLSFTVAFILNFRYIIPDFNQKFYYFRQLLRILNVFFQSLIPVVSLYFNPNISAKIKSLLTRRKYQVKS